jgi:hypothetical protein
MHSQFQEPLEIGQSVDLTRWHEDTTGFIDDGRGNRACHIHGKLVHIADVDRPASKKFGEQVLTWRLAIASRITTSTIKDISIQPVQEDSIGVLRERFPTAFKEYEKKYGADHLPERRDNVMQVADMGTVGEYTGAARNLAEYREGVRSLRTIAPMGKADRREYLENQLRELEGEVPDRAFEQPSEFAPATSGTPLVTFGAIPQTARYSLLNIGVQTVEAFAGLSDAAMQGLGTGKWNAWRHLAQDAVDKGKRKAG